MDNEQITDKSRRMHIRLGESLFHSIRVAAAHKDKTISEFVRDSLTKAAEEATGTQGDDQHRALAAT